MRMIYVVIALVLIGVIVLYRATRKNKTIGANSLPGSMQNKDTIQAQQGNDNAYEGLRTQALNVTAAQLQLALPNDMTKIYGIVMDWDVGEGVATLIAFSTGDASIYLSTGGGVIGGGQHENVSDASKAFIERASSYLDKANQTHATPLPDADCVRFYFLTNKGTYSAQEQLSNFENNSSLWLPLFEEGNKLIYQLHVIKENK